jgi:hypothetical protein
MRAESGAGSGEQADRLRITSAAEKVPVFKREMRINSVSEKFKKLSRMKFDSERFWKSRLLCAHSISRLNDEGQ